MNILNLRKYKLLSLTGIQPLLVIFLLKGFPSVVDCRHPWESNPLPDRQSVSPFTLSLIGSVMIIQMLEIYPENKNIEISF